MGNSYIERRTAGYYFVGSRVPLECIVREYWNGEPPESIRQHYPTLTLEQVHGGIAFYLRNRVDVDADVAGRAENEDAFRVANPLPTTLKEKLDLARHAAISRK